MITSANGCDELRISVNDFDFFLQRLAYLEERHISLANEVLELKCELGKS